MEIISPTTAKVSFRPTVEDQKRLMKKMIKEGSSKPDEDSEVYNFQKMKNPEGLTGQFIVEYDVVRDPSGGQVLVSLRNTSPQNSSYSSSNCKNVRPWLMNRIY